MEFWVAIGALGFVIWYFIRRSRSEQAPPPDIGIQYTVSVTGRVVDDSERDERASRRVFNRQAPRGGTSKGELRYAFSYRDAAGKETKRRVTIKSIEMIGDTVYVGALCDLRGEPGTFRADRMRDLVEATTGEIIDDPVMHFGSMDLTMTASGRDHQAAMSRARPGLVALSWIAAADGETSEAETEILVGWLRYRAGRQIEAVNMISARFYIDALRATFGESLAALTRLGKAERLEFEQVAKKMVVADGEINQAADRRLQRLLKAVKDR